MNATQKQKGEQQLAGLRQKLLKMSTRNPKFNQLYKEHQLLDFALTHPDK